MNYNTDNLGDDNVNIMPVGATNTSIDPITVSANEVEQAIVNLPAESRILQTPLSLPTADTENPDAVATGSSAKPSKDSKKNIKDYKTKYTPVSPTKGELKVMNYGLEKPYTAKRSYKYQTCGRRE